MGDMNKLFSENQEKLEEKDRIIVEKNTMIHTFYEKMKGLEEKVHWCMEHANRIEKIENEIDYIRQQNIKKHSQHDNNKKNIPLSIINQTVALNKISTNSKLQIPMNIPANQEL
ncbi:hypothetical protein JTB14_004128 [Gonioctena quinquepunctata]|nr:hypothetical protein JTB14_004128 [Gonioctena quinquepunctata]